jgi:hypothetical protein
MTMVRIPLRNLAHVIMFTDSPGFNLGLGLRWPGICLHNIAIGWETKEEAKSPFPRSSLSHLLTGLKKSVSLTGLLLGSNKKGRHILNIKNNASCIPNWNHKSIYLQEWLNPLGQSDSASGLLLASLGAIRAPILLRVSCHCPLVTVSSNRPRGACVLSSWWEQITFLVVLFLPSSISSVFLIWMGTTASFL